MKKTKTKYKQINSTHTCPLQRQKMVTSAIEVAVTQKYGSSAYFCAYVCLFVVRVFWALSFSRPQICKQNPKSYKNFRIFRAAADFLVRCLAKEMFTKRICHNRRILAKRCTKAFLHSSEQNFCLPIQLCKMPAKTPLTLGRCATTPIYSKKQASMALISWKQSSEGIVTLPNKSEEMLLALNIAKYWCDAQSWRSAFFKRVLHTQCGGLCNKNLLYLG